MRMRLTECHNKIVMCKYDKYSLYGLRRKCTCIYFYIEITGFFHSATITGITWGEIWGYYPIFLPYI